jgi:Flp pilus assembly pilin Flp
VEYGLILGLSAALAMVVLVFMGGTLGDVLDTIARAIDEAT